jgi:aldehyde dehydrogenase (NAD+)
MDVTTIVRQQKDFFKSQLTKDLEYRKASLKRLHNEIAKREKEIINALYDDFRKPEFESVISETTIVLHELDRALKNLSSWAKPEFVAPVLLTFPSSSSIHKEPYGTVLIISPWNYPFQLVFSPLIGAVAAGNTVVVKPSEHAPSISKVINNIISNVFDKNHVCVLEGDARVAEKLLKERWDYIFFTGSISIGRIVAKAAAENLTPATLELGGKNPCIVDQSAIIKLAARRIIWGKFINGGQTCIAPDYILVHASVKDDLAANIKNEITIAYGEDPQQSPDYPRIINQRNFDCLQNMIANEKILMGGKTDKTDLYISPTLIDNPQLDSEVMKGEIFGPILPIISFNDEKEVERIIAAYEKPLALYVFSNKKDFVKRMIEKQSFGGGTINDTAVHFANHRLPFGGVGFSGVGAYHGKHSFDTFSHKKGITRRYNWLDIPLRYAPYHGKLGLLKFFMKWFS